MNDIKFRNISESDLRCNVLIKGIKAKISEVEEKQDRNGKTYGIFLLMQGNSRIVALAFGETYISVKNILKIGKLIKFEPETFSCKLRDKKYNSNSTCNYDLTFLSGSNFVKKIKTTSSTTVSKTKNYNFCNLRKVAQLSLKSNPFTRQVKSIKFIGGEVYRYLGCKMCTRSITKKHTDGNYYCKGMCNNKQPRRNRIGVVTERKVCISINNVQLTDEDNETIESVVIFNAVCELLFMRTGSDFNSDNEAKAAWNKLIINNSYNLTIKRDKKKRGSGYPPTILVSMVDKVNKLRVTSDSNCTASEPVLECSNDARCSSNQENDPIPDFPKFEMKLRMTSVPYQKWSLRYQIASKPPGLVLLINNLNFPYRPDGKVRKGSEIDIDLLEQGFRVLGYEIYGNKCQLDIKTKADFCKLRDDFKTELIAKNTDSSFIIISSHGIHSQVCLPGENEEFLCIFKDMMIPFSDDEFPQFQGKPKVFMPITCQTIGSLTVEGVQDSFDLLGMGNKSFDMMICGPCFPGYSQWRYSIYGTLYVNTLMRNIMKYATTWHFTQILEKVQDDFKQQILKYKIKKITVPYFMANTFHQFYLVPKADLTDENSTDFNEMEVD